MVSKAFSAPSLLLQFTLQGWKEEEESQTFRRESKDGLDGWGSGSCEAFPVASSAQLCSLLLLQPVENCFSLWK